MNPAGSDAAAPSLAAGATSPAAVLPRGPVLDWSSWRSPAKSAACHSVEDLPHTRLTTSGRAAIYQALLQLRLPAGSGVLVPTYHCPTMIAPVLLAGLVPRYFGLAPDGLPQLGGITDASAAGCAAIVVPHYFGLPRSLAAVRRWCDERGIALIEDCAHCYFGDAGERPVGAWGDYSIASLSKFFPVSEAGLLASARRPIAPLPLRRAGLGAQLKGWVDVFETSSRHGRFAGIGAGLAALFRLKNGGRPAPAPQQDRPAPRATADFMAECDMARIDQTPLWAARALNATLPRGRIIVHRQRNYAAYARRFASVHGARPLIPPPAPADAPAAPYVFPLWVDDADAVYAGLRARRLPVFRWDRIWPGTPVLAGDVGHLWSRHVLQLLCHQDLSPGDIERTADTVLTLLDRSPSAAPRPLALCA